MPRENVLIGAGLRMLGMLCLASLAAFIKLAEARGAGLLELMFFRQLCAIPVVVGWVAATGGLSTLATSRMSAHVGRTAVGLLGMVTTFGAILLLPLAEATTLQFTAPIFATLLGALVLREPTGWHRWAAVVAGFVGVLIVAQPGSGHFPLFGAVVGLSSAALVATVAILLRQIGRTESAGTTVFWFSVLSIPPLGLAWLFDLRTHDAGTWALLVTIGLLGGVGQLALTGAVRFAPVSVVVPMDYTSLIWATLYGWLLFGMLPTEATLIGAPIIIVSGLYIAWREQRLNRKADAAAPQV